ncbi:MAG: hypothetical protein IPJ34_43710 [Myxococcales bacterium]|nr:hypothetical protein [Myxococcales bacterium]
MKRIAASLKQPRLATGPVKSFPETVIGLPETVIGQAPEAFEFPSLEPAPLGKTTSGGGWKQETNNPAAATTAAPRRNALVVPALALVALLGVGGVAFALKGPSTPAAPAAAKTTTPEKPAEKTGDEHGARAPTAPRSHRARACAGREQECPERLDDCIGPHASAAKGESESEVERVNVGIGARASTATTAACRHGQLQSALCHRREGPQGPETGVPVMRGTVLTLTTLLLMSTTALADDKKICSNAYEKAQDLRDKSSLLAARELKICAKAPCTGFLLKDCITWLEEVQKKIPTVVLAAVSAKGDSITDVSVRVGDKTLTGWRWRPVAGDRPATVLHRELARSRLLGCSPLCKTQADDDEYVRTGNRARLGLDRRSEVRCWR